MILRRDGGVISCDAIEAAPALVEIRMVSHGYSQTTLGGAALQSLNAALRHGALQNLQDVSLLRCGLGRGDFCDFIDALGQSDCSKRLVSLYFEDCGLDASGVCALGDLVARDTFPALEVLGFDVDPRITDVGVIGLAKGLSKATQTFLKSLTLSYVGLGDEGIAALAPLVYEGRLKKLETLNLSNISDVTDWGLVTLHARSMRTDFPC